MKHENAKAGPDIADKPDRLGSALLVIICGVTALRATYIEAPHVEQNATALTLSSELVSLLWSTVLLGCVAVWAIREFIRGTFQWRSTKLGIGTGLFFAAGLIALTQASDKRAAITDLVTLTAPMLAGMLLVQLFRCKARVRLALFVLVAVGAAAAVACIDQFYSSNQALVSEYEANPAKHLEQLGIEEGTLEHWMYEHRLHSKGVRGFLLTGNSTASFFILAIFAGIALCAEGLSSLRHAIDKQRKEHALAAVVCYGLIVLLIAAGAALTKSKGGLASMAAGLGLFGIWLIFGKWLRQRPRTVGAVVLVLIAAGAAIATAYGAEHGRLPGGNSMLVRWQYWTSAAAMIGDHPLTGVGGGNFSDYYFRYKVPAASETIQDPHNWVLSLLCQYGPLGLIAFAAAIWGSLCLCGRDAAAISNTAGRDSRRLAGWILATATALLLIVRPLLVDTEFLFREEAKSAAYAYVLLYLVPAAVFAGVLFLLHKASAGIHDDESQPGRGTRTAIMCGIIALLVHNLIDFAIFEPGVWGWLWLLIALLAADVHNDSAMPSVKIFTPGQRFAAVFVILAAAICYLYAAVIMPARAQWLLNQAMRSDFGRMEKLRQSVAADPLAPDAAFTIGGMIAEAVRQSDQPNKQLLQEALTFADMARRRDPANFKPYRLRGEICLQMASAGSLKTEWQSQALEACEQALERYPGSDRLHFEAAQIAESLGQDEKALNHFRKAIEIEDAFRTQFQVMYPDEKRPISRIGQSNYQEAKDGIARLSE